MTKVLGIGGGAGVGKTTLASFLREKGIAVLELDELARTLAQKGGPLWKQVVKVFGRSFLDRDGYLNRKKLGRVAFRNWKILFVLNEVSHPLLLQEAKKWLQRKKNEALVGIEGAVLFEGGFLNLIDWVIFVDADSEVCTQRLQAKGWTEKDTRDLLLAQRFLPCLRRRANLILGNQNSLERLHGEAEFILRKFVGKPGNRSGSFSVVSDGEERR